MADENIPPEQDQNPQADEAPQDAAVDVTPPETTVEETPAHPENIQVFGRGGHVNFHGSDTVRAFDFDRTSFLTPQETRRLRQIHENFVRNLTARLSMYLRIEIDMELDALESTTMRQGLNKMDDSTHLSLIRMTPLRGHSVVEVPIPLSLSIVDRLLGGPAKLTDEANRLNDVEISLLDDVLSILGSEWANLWAHLIPMQPAIVGHESNPKYLCASSLDSAALQMVIKTTIGECQESIRMIVPHLTIEPLVGGLRQVGIDTEENSEGTVSRRPDWSNRFDNVPVHLSTWCSGPKISLKEMAELKIGQFLSFNSGFFDAAVLKVAGKEAFHGNIGKINEQWAFKIAENIEN
jgi:flagellar motor switch protein FliM